MVYQEYRSVYGKDAESALRFLFNAFAAKPEPELPFEGLRVTIYMDNSAKVKSDAAVLATMRGLSARARAGGCHCQQVRRAVVMQQLPGFCRASD